MTTQETVDEFILLTQRKQQLESDLSVIKKELDEMEPKILEHFEKHGIQRITQDGLTVYLSRSLWAGKDEGVENDEAIEALNTAGLGMFAEPRINVSSLSRYFRDLEENGEPFPKCLEGKIRLIEKFKLGAKNGQN
jgi:hypothetical protein